MFELILGAVSAVVVALIGALSTIDMRARSKREKRLVQKTQLRADESHLSMKMMSAAIDLGVATAIAVAEGRSNGEMKLAREKALKVQDEYDAFIKKIAAGQVTDSG